MNIFQTKRFCKFAHLNQVDKCNAPYFLHPFRIEYKLSNEPDDVRIVALLHDVVEDTGFTIDDLIDMGYNKNITDAVDAITKRRDESWNNYIDRVSKNKIARKVKIEDLKDNLDMSRFSKAGINPPENWDKNIEKYKKALVYLI
jgi:(p)ppGpp synthase/HD superfamily hydrolase